ncbi:MAG: carbon-nitrogen hydrolase [Gemmatimonadetes bacterium]|nr:carbon-nitrogen hydrolase [Gemmatimonadota bacterium]
MRLAVFQCAPALRDLAGNARRIATTAAEVGADLLLTPELSLSGYDLGDDAALLAAPVRPGAPATFAPGLEGAPDVIVGVPERGDDGVVYNAAVHVRDGRVLFRHRKRYLPTYGMFDEMRYFGRGARIDAYDAGDGWRIGLLVCEDFWHPALAYLLATRRIQLLLVQAAAPGRGVWEVPAPDDLFASMAVWERIARTTAQLYGIYVALANRVGVEGAVTFAGGSLIVGPGGEVLARAPQAEEAVLEAELSTLEVARSRRPYAHLRDEDGEWTLRELRRALEET